MQNRLRTLYYSKTEKMKVKEIIPVIDDVVEVYQKNRAVLLAFGETDVDKIVGLVNTVKGLIRK